MTERSQLIQPLISTEAIADLRSVVPNLPPRTTSVSDQPTSHESVLNTRSAGATRLIQVVLTSLPLFVADLTAVCVTYVFSAAFTDLLIHSKSGFTLLNNVMAAGIGYFLLAGIQGLYPASGMNPVCELRNQVLSIFGAGILVIVSNALVGEFTRNELVALCIAVPVASVTGPLMRFGARRVVSRFSWWGEKVVVVGEPRQASRIYRFLKNYPQRGLRPEGMMTRTADEYWRNATDTDCDFLGTSDELVAVCRRRHCHWVIAAVADQGEDGIQEILTQGSLIPNFIVVYSNFMLPTMWVSAFEAAGLPGIHIRDRLLFPFQRLAKRLFDVAFSACVLLAVSPVILLVALWIRLASPGPVFFQHHGRIGRNGRTFGAWKIRTMVPDAQQVLEKHLEACPEAKVEWEQNLKLKSDPRIIPGIGQFLRKTSLDEIPQLWNVLVGDMSIVGPRPIYTDIEVGKFQELFPFYLRVRPGLTGLWQVSGRNNTTYEDRVRLDTYYVRNWSLWLDYFILLRTVRTVVFREGSY